MMIKKEIPIFLRDAANYLDSVFRPFPFIKELEGLQIKTFKDLVRVNDFVFSMVPWVGKYFDLSFLFDMQNDTVVDFLYTKFKKREAGGWCGLNAEFLYRVLLGFGIKNLPYNYGVIEKEFTHVVVIAELDSKKYLLDPYFCKYYTKLDDSPLPFDELIDLVKEKKLDEIKTVQSITVLKPVLSSAGDWSMQSPADLESVMIEGFRGLGLKDFLRERYGSENVLNLLLSGDLNKNVQK